jgi:hypothetical protein
LVILKTQKLLLSASVQKFLLTLSFSIYDSFNLQDSKIFRRWTLIKHSFYIKIKYWLRKNIPSTWHTTDDIKKRNITMKRENELIEGEEDKPIP